ncbi:MAG: alpha/beta hydrolase [Planctomycetaceae bacterium]|nr:alpha/beta hydrolase [Planctomycetaceae bacterium]
MPQPAQPSLTATRQLLRLLQRLILLLCLCYFGVLLLFAGLQRKLIYAPDPRSVQPQQPDLDPQRVEQLTLNVGKNVRLLGWWSRVTPGRDSQHVVLLFPGNGGNRGNRAPLLKLWNSLGYDAILFDYRGYGGSTGSPSESAMAHDALAIWSELTTNRGLTPERIIVSGQSLGGGVATRLVWDLKQKRVTPRGLILTATFSSLTDAGAYHYPWLPVSLVLIDRYPSAQRIGAINCPLLMLHGQRDRVVPYALGQKLFNHAPATAENGLPKQFISLPNADHNDILQTQAAEVAAAYRQFLLAIDQRTDGDR